MLCTTYHLKLRKVNSVCVFLNSLLSSLKNLQVIVGANGSGKSTILKLVARLYEPSDGQILINGKNIRTLKLDDLRLATSVLFQDYTHFPLSVGLNLSFFLCFNGRKVDKR